MKRRYNTLNEEVNRMKSLFGESRLYGNLVDNKEKNILTEGYRFFDNLSDAFKLTFRSLDDLGKFTKFINVEINNVDDIVKHVRQFPGLWKTIASGVKNWDAVLKNLEVLLKKNDIKEILKILEKLVLGYSSKSQILDKVFLEKMVNQSLKKN